MSGIAAAFYLAGLLFAAPLLATKPSYRLADRLRDALILGIAIVLIAGTCNALYPLTLWTLLAGACALALARKQRVALTPIDLPVITLCAVVLVAWPGLIRPPLDGDTLAYHLPNAAAWANAHGLWTNLTFYWWYPPASELFASGLYSVAGPFAVGWTGTLAIAFLGVRMREWWQSAGPRDALLADLAGATVVTLLPLAWQAASMQNDVFLAAFIFDALASANRDGPASIRSACVAALTKPYGWIVAAIALARKPVWLLLPVVGVALWALHDLALDRSAPYSMRATTLENPWLTTIAAHLPAALPVFAQSLVAHAPGAALLFFVALVAPVFLRTRYPWMAVCACACALLFFALPYAYDTGGPQLASGMSLRHLATAFVLALALLATVASHGTKWFRVAFAASSIYGAGTVISTFWNDAPTIGGLLAATVILVLALVTTKRQTALPLAAGALLLAVVSVPLASRHTIEFVRDATPYGLLHSDAFAPFAQMRPRAFVADGVRAGTLLLLDPSAIAIDATDFDARALAAAYNAPLVAFASLDQAPGTNRRRLSNAKLQRVTVYSDAMSVLTVAR